MTAELDLRWFFSEAEGDLGLRGASLEPGLGLESDPHERASRRLENASRWADVAHRLRAISRRHERALRLAYTPHRWPGLEDWFELAGVAALLVDPCAVVAAGRRIPRRTEPQQRELRDRARHVLGLALTAYRGAHGR